MSLGLSFLICEMGGASGLQEVQRSRAKVVDFHSVVWVWGLGGLWDHLRGQEGPRMEGNQSDL